MPLSLAQQELDAGRPVYSTQELQAEFSVEAFAAPFVVVVRKADGVKGSLMFQSNPRLYFGFVADA